MKEVSEKKLRNQYASLLLEQTLNKKLSKPFTFVPGEDPLVPFVDIAIKSYNEIISKLKQGNILEELEQKEIVKKQNTIAHEDESNKEDNESKAEIERLKSEVDILRLTITNLKTQLMVLV